MQTDRDGEIVAWLSRMGAASAQQVGERFGIDTPTAYVRLRTLREAKLVQNQQMLYRFPGMHTATRQGLSWQGFGNLPTCSLSPSTFKHAWHSTEVALALERKMPAWQLLTEREIRALERDEDKLIVSARTVPQMPGPKTHRADLALISPCHRASAIEVELMCKGRLRLEKICRAWLRAQHVDHVYYLATPMAGRAVKRAIQAVRAVDFITVLELDDIAGLVERELAKEETASRSAAATPSGCRAP